MKIEYRRFSRRRLLSIGVNEFHLAIFPVCINQVRVTKTKSVAAKLIRPPIAYIRLNPDRDGDARKMVQRSHAQDASYFWTNNMITAQTTLLANRQTLANLRTEQMTASVQLIESLGGSWNVAQLTPPKKSGSE